MVFTVELWVAVALGAGAGAGAGAGLLSLFPMIELRNTMNRNQKINTTMRCIGIGLVCGTHHLVLQQVKPRKCGAVIRVGGRGP